MKINADLKALYTERDRLKADLQKIEKDIETLLVVSGSQNTIIVDGREFVFGIDLGDD